MKESTRVAEMMQENKKETRSSLIQKVDSSQISGSLSDRVVFLQRNIGNNGVEKLIRSGALHAKLKIGQPGDKYEQEADRVAEQVMRMSEPQKVPGNNIHIQRACTGCEENELKRQPIKEEEEEKLRRQSVEDEEEKLQAKGTSGFTPEVDPGIENQIQSMRSGGNPLSEGERAFFEPRFRHDLSQMRVHTDVKAAESAQPLNASAFTIGKNMVFGQGRYAPETSSCKSLLDHELTHMVEQNPGGMSKKLEEKET